MHEFGAAMAARATRSASRRAVRNAEAVATGPLGALSHDELGVIVDGLADPLQPVVAVALSSTCKGLRTPLRAALEVLQQRHERAVALCQRMGTSCTALRDAEELLWCDKYLTRDEIPTLGMILRTNGLHKLRTLALNGNIFGDVGVRSLCEQLGRDAAPRLSSLCLGGIGLGPAGAAALAATLRTIPKLEELTLAANQIGLQGVVALAPVLRKLPALKRLDLGEAEIGDDDVEALLINLGKDDFKALQKLYLDGNELTDKTCHNLIAALKAGALPALEELHHPEADAISEHASEEALWALNAALHQH